VKAAAERLRRLLPGAWLGLLLAIGALSAPASFALLPRGEAGRLNAHLFEREAWVAIVLALVLVVLERARARRAAEAGRGSVLSAELLLLMGTLACTLAGAFAVQPMMQAARAGAAGLPGFGTLHALSVGLYALKVLLVAALAWRATATE
jgi:hypothetical protein